MTTISTRSIKHFLATTAVALAIPMTAAASPDKGADCGPMGRPGGAGRHGDMAMPGFMGEMSPHHLRGLNLTEAQQDKVFEILHAQAPVMREHMKALRKAEGDLRTLASSPDYSEAKAKPMADAVARTMADMALARTRTARQIFDLLTPEQRKKMAEMNLASEPGRDMAADGRTPAAR